jgi:outer membrane protein TolC
MPGARPDATGGPAARTTRRGPHRRPASLRGLAPLRGLARAGALCAALAGCAASRPQPLADRPALARSVAALDRTRPHGPPIPADRPLTLADVAVLAVSNSPDLRATRTQRGLARAQVFQAGLLPDPVLSGSYNVLIAGPAFANAIGATLTADVAALIALSARRRAARAAADQTDAAVVWQEWQTIARARTLAIDLVEQGRLLRSLEGALDLLQRRAATSRRAVAEGNATLQSLAPDLAALTSLRTQYDAAVLLQEQRWQSLDALLGLEPSVRPPLAADPQVPAISPGAATAMLADLSERRPDLVALRFGYQSQEASVRVAILGQFPATTLGPNYGNDTSNVQSAGPAASVALPVLNGNRGALAIARATRDQLRAEYAARLAAAAGGAEALLANLALEERQLAGARAGLGASRALAKGAGEALRSGLIDELSYVQLVVTRLEKERQVIGLEQQVLDERTALATLLGAGLPRLALPPPRDPGL